MPIFFSIGHGKTKMQSGKQISNSGITVFYLRDLLIYAKIMPPEAENREYFLIFCICFDIFKSS